MKNVERIIKNYRTINDKTYASYAKMSVTMINEIKNNPKISAKKLSEILNVSLRTAQYHLSKLISDGRVKKIGKTSSGYWEVIE